MMKRAAALLLVALFCPSPAFAKSPARGRFAMVATEQHYATQVGVDVLKRGGNAIDAAVAIGYALAVVDPCCGNIGGGGFMLIRMANGAEKFVDFRERAPIAAKPSIFLDANSNIVKDASTKTYRAVGVPGTVMGLEYARAHYGTRSRQVLIEPAIDLARNGYTLEPGDVRVYADGIAELIASPAGSHIFRHGGSPYAAGQRLRQPELAVTLTEISRSGPDAFYKGSIARTIVEDSKAHGGLLTMEDFTSYRVQESAPIHCSYRGYTITSAPPPSSGGTTLCEILNIVSGFPLSSYGWNSARSVHVIAEAERRAYADRNTYLADPNFVKNPVAQLLAPAYAAKLRNQIQPDRATPSVQVRPGLGPVEETQTTHYSVVDRFGNAVAVTYTINGSFGTGIIAGNTGFFLNNEMDDFTSKPGAPNEFGLVQGVRNSVQGGKRPLSSMSPTIVTKSGKLFMIVGSPGGGRIITIVLSVLQNVIDYGMNVQDAVDAPRVHQQWLPDVIDVERNALAPAERQKLAAMGYVFKDYSGWGSAQAILIDPKTRTLYGGTDRRRSAGLALGY